jgi:hypothetical protein
MYSHRRLPATLFRFGDNGYHRPHDSRTLFPAQADPDYEKISGIVSTLNGVSDTSNFALCQLSIRFRDQRFSANTRVR